VRPSYINDELAVTDDAGEVTVFRKLEVDVALFPSDLCRPTRAFGCRSCRCYQ
jgi:hypothetical protein